MNLYEEIEKLKAIGYSEQDAQSKLGQDIVLKAIADSGMARNATIKGGVGFLPPDVHIPVFQLILIVHQQISKKRLQKGHIFMNTVLHIPVICPHK